MPDEDRVKKVEEKVFDTIPLSELEEEEKKDLGPYVHRGKTRFPWKKGAIFFILILFAIIVGIALGWLVIELIMEREMTSFEKGISIRDMIGLSPSLDRIGLTIYQRSPSSEKRELGRRITIRKGERLSVDYGREILFVSEIRLKKNLGAIFSKTPRIFLDGRLPINFKDDIVALTRPEEKLSIPMEVKASAESKPLGVFYLDLRLRPEDWISRADAIKGKGNPERQRICYRNALKEEPRRIDFLIAYGKFLMENRDFKESEAVFQKVLLLQKGNIDALRALSSIYFDLQPKKAIDLYERLLQIDPSNKLTYYKRIAHAQKRIGLDSTETLKKIISVDPKDEEAIQALEVKYGDLIEKAKKAQQSGMLLEAIELAKKARNIRNNEATTQYLAALYNNLGFSHAEKKEYAKALSFYKESIQLKPDATTYLNMAMAYERLGKGKEALQVLEKAIGMKPKDAKTQRDIFVLLGRELERQKSYKKAIEIYRRSIQVYPKDPDTLISLGMLLFNEKAYDEAIDYLKRAIALSSNENAPENAEIYRLMGEIYVKKAHTAQRTKERIDLYNLALGALDKVISLKNDDQEAKRRWNEIASERMSLRMKMLKEEQ